MARRDAKRHWSRKGKRKRSKPDAFDAYMASLPPRPPDVPEYIVLGDREVWRHDPRNDRKPDPLWPGDEAAKEINRLYYECCEAGDFDRYEREVAKLMQKPEPKSKKQRKRGKRTLDD